MDKELSPIEIDLGVARRGELNESFLSMFGGALKMLYRHMFGDPDVYLPITVRGTQNEMSSFAKVLNREKQYLDAYNEYGLNNPATYKNKYRLDDAIKKFEQTTDIKWPFK